MKIAFDSVENKELLVIHVDFEVPGISWISSEPDTIEARELKALLLEINGIYEVTSHDYTIRVKRGGVFSWTELKPLVRDAILNFAKADECEEVKSYS